jgi:hypothetical protein
VLPRAGSEPPGFDAANRRIEVRFCDGDDSGLAPHAAEVEAGFEAGGRDIALLRVLRPASYQPVLRALAAPPSIEARQEAWLLGQDDLCGVAPRTGAVAALANAQGDLRVEFPGVRGGASGGPALSGYGVIGLVTNADDQTFTVHGMASLEARVRAYSNAAWALADARNIPPSDPNAASIDLAETLNQYLFSVRNLQGVLLQPEIARRLYFDVARDYNTAVMKRYMPARERHDGALRRYWPEAVFMQWQALRDLLWRIHENFLAFNEGDSKFIFDNGRAPEAVQKRMRALEPDLRQLQTDIAEFLRALSQRSKP